jgi:predicted RNase H-like nuclease
VSRLVAVGVDGARGGWAVACLYEDGTRLMLLGDIGEIADVRAGTGAPVAIDIPIGLLDSVGFRPCDVAARRLLGRRASTVFAPPARYMLAAAGDYGAIRALVADERQRNPAAKGLSAQSAGIAPKVREVDEWVRAHPDSERWLFECHPELSFVALNGGAPPSASKRSPAGAQERLRLVRAAFPDAEAQLAAARRPATSAERAPARRPAASAGRATARRPAASVGRADWLDAYAALHSAAAIARGEHAALGVGALDSEGVPMRIVHAPCGRKDSNPHGLWPRGPKPGPSPAHSIHFALDRRVSSAHEDGLDDVDVLKPVLTDGLHAAQSEPRPG